MISSFLQHFDDDTNDYGRGQGGKYRRDAFICIPNKTKVLSMTGHCTLAICINGQNNDGVELFVYLNSVFSVDGGSELDIIRCINTARFVILSKLCK